MVGADGVTTLQGGWGSQGAMTEGTCEEIDELVHGGRGIVPGQDSLRKAVEIKCLMLCNH